MAASMIAINGTYIAIAQITVIQIGPGGSGAMVETTTGRCYSTTNATDVAAIQALATAAVAGTMTVG